MCITGGVHVGGLVTIATEQRVVVPNLILTLSTLTMRRIDRRFSTQRETRMLYDEKEGETVYTDDTASIAGQDSDAGVSAHPCALVWSKYIKFGLQVVKMRLSVLR